jgi:hypothetical protein
MTQNTQNTQTYEVKCRTCRTLFKVALFDSHEKNLFVVDKKDWYCDACKKAYFSRQTTELSGKQQEIGFPALTGTEKMVSWAVKIRGEMMQKVDYLKKSLKFANDAEAKISEKAFSMFMDEWRQATDAKWWIDRRTMNVRDISLRIKELSTAVQEAQNTAGKPSEPQVSD